MPAIDKTRVLRTAHVVLLSFGAIVVIIGTILPLFITRFDVTKTQAGSLLLLLSLGMLLTAAIFGPAVDRFGYKRPMLLSLFGMMLSVVGLGLAPSFRLLQVSAFLIGATGGIVNGASNSLVSEVSGNARGSALNTLGVFFGIGAVSTPVLLGWLLQFATYGRLLPFMALLLMIPVGAMLRTEFPPSRHAHGLSLNEVLALVRNPELLLLGLLLALQTGMEMTAGGWSTTLLVDHLGMADDRAVGLFWIFWTGLIAARYLLSKTLRHTSERTMMQLSIGVVILGALLMVLSRNEWMALPGLFLLGFGLGGGYPIILAFTGARFTRLSGTAFSIVFLMGLIGGSLAPYLLGIAADAVTLRIAFLAAPLLALVQLGLLGRVRGQKTAPGMQETPNVESEAS